MKPRDLLAVAAVAITVGGFTLLGGAVFLPDTPSPAPTPTTTTSALPWCEGEHLVVPGTGIVEWAPRCDIPPQHDPPNTGPTTGPNGEPHG